ncbi:hypothetical protein [Nocardiopsis sp. NPDC058789]|uniref:hypothetical protein n=1 Tax=Nocardiopsis sp. NPDC058789 TaxID=3346634 RepID=UPI00366C3F68
MSQPPTSPDSEAQQREKDNRATQLEAMLRWAGLSDRGIEKLRNGQDRTGPGWQRLAKAVENKYPAMGKKSAEADAVRPAVVEGLRFARRGSSSLQEFAYRYEYFKALYDEQSQDILTNRRDLSKTERHELASRRMTRIDAQGVLDSDTEIIRKERSQERVDIDLNQSEEEIVAAIREQAENIGMGHDTSTAYHARKHFGELPKEEQVGHPISAYLKSLASTIQNGEASNFTRMDEGQSASLVIDRILPRKRDGSPKRQESEAKEAGEVSVLRARLFVRPHTGVVAPTHMRDKAERPADHERG